MGTGRSLRVWVIGAALASLLARVGAGHAAPRELVESLVEPTTVAPTPPALTAAQRAQQIAAERTALAATLDETRHTLNAAPPESQEPLRQEVALLLKLDLVYGQQLAVLKQGDELGSAGQQVQDELSHMRAGGLPESAPHSLLTLDAVQDDLDGVQDQVQAVESAVRAAEEAVQQGRDLAAERERARRAAKEAFETNHDALQMAGLEQALRVAQLESRVATEQLHLHELELANQRLMRGVHESRVAMLAEKVARLAVAARLTRDELQAQLADLEKDEAELQRSQASARRELETAERRAMMAQQRYDQSAAAGRATASAELAARRLARETLEAEVASLAQRLQRLAEVKVVWTRRYEVSTLAPSRTVLAQWERDARQAVEQLEREDRSQRSRLAQVRKTAKALAQEIVDTAGTAPEAARWLIEQQERLQEQTTTYEAHLTSLETVRHVHEKLLRQIERQSTGTSLRERSAQVLEAARGVWFYELTAVDDRPITVGKILLGFFLVTLGFVVARFLSRLLGRRILPRLGLDPHASRALQSVSFYVLVTLLTLFVLNVINVPLTVFTFVGGALAIGIGFGSQNVVNNFISGLILLAERPIRIGDLIEVEGTHGTVERIGPRSTRVRVNGSVDIIVPNSAFLEKNVVNWTLSDDTVRTRVRVGVDYGSSPSDVTRLLQRAVADHARILKSPEPHVLFADFGDNVLAFEVHFWIRVRTEMDQRILESDVRYRIERLFSEGGIVMAFPQRDVHLDTTKPLEVQIVTAPANPEET